MSIYVVFKVEFKLVRTCLVIVREECLMIDNIKNINLNGGVCSSPILNRDPKGIICNKRSVWIMKEFASILYCSRGWMMTFHHISFYLMNWYIHVL